MDTFLPRNAMLARYAVVVFLYVCLSDGLSQASVLLTQINAGRVNYGSRVRFTVGTRGVARNFIEGGINCGA